ncbi:hypothetical protein [Alkaliphilus hydrothermalis]|uniref:Phr family secreted Rap phosphatase inhibitor n=1 Tax=Alkaliphilus hydrothermalis TaxID=1482730 RepID=A0ABS2NN41_9FIRM|nr:hypothetical protein [Alkaliphilus hydrothermalis]MBM7614322.1 hypothetical protein [Alkaliphilus hydrothermalis]
MKRSKILFAVVITLTILLGNLNLVDSSNNSTGFYSDSYSTNQEPNPVAS